MKRLLVDLDERSYPIIVGQGVLQQLPTELMDRGITPKQKVLIVTDDHVAELYLRKVQGLLEQSGYVCSAHIAPSGEKAKALSHLEEIVTSALAAGLDRNSVILALGGGVIGDLAGFAASTYMRGISFVQLPTTLLAHDSSVGGKVAVNHPMGKNLIGAFHQPSLVLYDTSTLASLPQREVSAGFAEVIKHAILTSPTFFSWLNEHAEALMELKSPYIDEAIYQGCQIKSQIVAADEQEHGLRAVLNLGHTFGHAIEALSQYGSFNHGEAVSIGLVAAVLLAKQLGLATEPDNSLASIVSILKRFKLPVRLPGSFDPEEMVETMKHDKKGKLVFVLPKTIGQVEIVKDVNEAIVVQVLEKLKEVE
jgi:3-dehydroquinate synthase